MVTLKPPLTLEVPVMLEACVKRALILELLKLEPIITNFKFLVYDLILTEYIDQTSNESPIIIIIHVLISFYANSMVCLNDHYFRVNILLLIFI